jgi:hypothetical protein
MRKRNAANENAKYILMENLIMKDGVAFESMTTIENSNMN